MEPLWFWSDLLRKEILPSEVAVLVSGGDKFSALECDLALALGASVNVIEGGGGAADELLIDPFWTRMLPEGCQLFAVGGAT